MKHDSKLLELLFMAEEKQSFTKEDCCTLLDYAPASQEAAVLRSHADLMTRRRLGNSALILGQIGLEVSRCPAGCRFCMFGQSSYQLESFALSDEEITQKAHEFCDYGDIYGLFLMTMHMFSLDRLLNAVSLVRKNIPASTKIWVNVGDADLRTFETLKQVGVSGAYHACRLREGKDTSITPAERIRTMENIRAAGLELYTCCEPIGPEHTNEELADAILLGVSMGCSQHAAMRRTPVPGTPLAAKGTITEQRLAQIVAVLTLATAHMPNLDFISAHEPNQLSLGAGSCLVTAESGSNPRDIFLDTSISRGFSTARCRRMLFDAGFEKLLLGDGTTQPLDVDYLNKTDSGYFVS